MELGMASSVEAAALANLRNAAAMEARAGVVHASRVTPRGPTRRVAESLVLAESPSRESLINVGRVAPSRGSATGPTLILIRTLLKSQPATCMPESSSCSRLGGVPVVATTRTTSARSMGFGY
jgi:hypothetical protein